MAEKGTTPSPPLTSSDGFRDGRTVPMRVLAMGMPRTGTHSICTALEILGMPCYHGFVLLARPGDGQQWNPALDWKLRGLPLPPLDADPDGRPSVAFWDRLLGAYGAAADVPAIIFVEELLAAYPAAKVVLVERDVESWYRSFDTGVVAPMWSSTFRALAVLDPYVIGPMTTVARRWAAGWFEATSLAEMRANCRRTYREHYAHVRRVTPPERLLEFELKDGWGPLCEFLGEEVPDVPFPRTNDAAAFQVMLRQLARQGMRNAVGRYWPWAVALAAVALAFKLYQYT